MAQTRDRIIAATSELFRVYGFNGTSLSQISAASGATTGSIYHFFPGGKDELTAVVIDTTGVIYRELFEALVADARDPASAVEGFFEGAAAVLVESGYIDPCPIGTIAREVASTNDTLRQSARAAFKSWTEAAETHLLAAGILPGRARDLAVLFVAAIEGGFVLSRTERSGEPLFAAGRLFRTLIEAAVDESAKVTLADNQSSARRASSV